MLSFTEDSVTLEEVDEYATARGRSSWTEAPSSPPDAKLAAIRRGTDFVAATYNARWTVEFDHDDAPEEIKYAISEAAIRELAKPNSLMPDRKRGGLIKSVGAGSARVEFMDGAPADTVFTVIDGMLSGLVTPVSGPGEGVVGYCQRS